MRTILTITGLGLLAAACATPAAFPRAHVRTADPELERRAEQIRRLTVERIAHARELARASVSQAGQRTDASERRAALARAWRLARSVLADRTPQALAALAPDVLRVYDLGRVLDDGPDETEDVGAVLGAPDEVAVDGGRALLQRIAQRLRAADPTLWEGDTFVAPVGECLVVLQRPERFETVERDLDRLATTGGGFARVRLAVIETDEEPAGATAWEDADYDQRLAQARAAGNALRELSVDVPFGRARGAFDGVQASYVQDFDVDAPSGLADPLVGTLRSGLVISATFDAPERDGVGRVELTVGRSEALQPIPQFTTQIEPDAEPVTIQIPEARVIALSDRVAPTPAGSARAALARNVAVGEPGTLPVARGAWVVVHTQAHGERRTARPAWTRVQPAAAAASFDAPLLEQAAPLAALHLAQRDPVRAAAEIRFALTHAQGHVWRQRLRVSPDVSEGVLVRWPSPVPDAETERALRESSVAPADGCGFVDVIDGVVVACVTPESAGAVARVLGALSRHGPTGGGQAAFDGTSGNGLWCAATDQLSFVQDFDVQVAQGAAIADPIIGVLQEGAVAHALPVRSAGPGTYDIRITHASVAHPIEEFTTSLSRGAPVTIQLPRLHLRTTWRRVVLARGESVEMETRVGSGASEDVRRFVLRSPD